MCKFRTENQAGPSSSVAVNINHSFTGEIRAPLWKIGIMNGLSEKEVDMARVAAENSVNQASRKTRTFPWPEPEEMFSGTCNIVAEGLPLVGSKHQRCCKVRKAVRSIDEGETVPYATSFSADDGDYLERLRGRGSDGAHQKGGLKKKEKKRKEEGGNDDAKEKVKGDKEKALPGVPKSERRGGIGQEQVACLPSFVIAGSQKSGTTALTGERSRATACNFNPS